MMDFLKDRIARLHDRFKPFYNLDAWIMIAIGMLLFSARIQFAPGGWINVPVLFTVFQTAGLMFAIVGLELIASLALWPTINLSDLLREVGEKQNIAAGLVILGLFLFNGLLVIAFVTWLNSAMGAGIAAG